MSKKGKQFNFDQLRSERFKVMDKLDKNRAFLNDCFYAARSNKSLSKVLKKSKKSEKLFLQKTIENCIAQNAGIEFGKHRTCKIKKLSGYKDLLEIYQKKVSCDEFVEFLSSHYKLVYHFLGYFGKEAIDDNLELDFDEDDDDDEEEADYDREQEQGAAAGKIKQEQEEGRVDNDLDSSEREEVAEAESESEAEEASTITT